MAEEKSKGTNPYSDDIRPGFLSNKQSEKKEKGGFFGFGKKKERSSEAASDLANAEEGAASEEGLKQGEGIDGANETEEKAGGFYSGRGGATKGLAKGKRSKIAFVKHGGPSFGILGLVVGIGGFMSGAQSFMPIAIKEMIVQKFNSIGISSTMASDAWLNTQLNIGVRTGKLTNSSSGISGTNGGGRYNGSAVGDVTWSEYKNATIALGSSDAPLLWETPRDSVSWVQGATISEDYYIYALTGHVDENNGHPNARIVVVDRDTGQQVIPNIVPNSRDLNTLHYDYANRQIWAQTGNGESNDTGIRGQCYSPSTGLEVACVTYGPRGYAATEGSGYAAQGRDAVNGAGFLAVWKTSDDLAIVRICSATSDCTEANTLTINGFAQGELEDLAFDANGDMVLIFNRWDNGNRRLSYYKVSRAFLSDNFNIDTVPLGDGSVINSDGSTGVGVYVADYSDVTIIGDSISTDAAVGVNGNGRNLFAEYLPGANYGESNVGAAVASVYGGVPYTQLHYSKSFSKEQAGNASGLTVLNAIKNDGKLGEYVLFLLGTNDNGGNLGWLSEDNLIELMKAVGPDRKVVLMTDFVHSGRGWNFATQNDLIKRFANDPNYAGRIAVADWGAIANDNDIRLNADGNKKNFHFTEAGGEKFVQEVKRALDSIRPVGSTPSRPSGGSSSGSSGSSSSLAELFAFSEFQVEQFEKQGIDVVTASNDDATFTALLYKKGLKRIPVVGTDFINTEGIVDAISAVSGYSNIGTPVTSTQALADDDFKIPYTTASKSWRGGVSGWFDNIMSSVTEIKLSINRNRWAKYVTTSIRNITDSFAQTAKSIAQASTTDGGMDKFVWMIDEDGNGEYVNAHVIEYDSEGATPEELSVVGRINDGNTTDLDVTNTKVQPSDSVNKIGKVLNNKAVKAAAKILDVSCAVLEAMTSIYTVVSAYQSLQFLNLISGFLEAVDKAQAGDGDGSPVNTYGNNLTNVGDTTDENNNVVARRTAMQSAGMAWLFSNTKIEGNNISVGNVNFETIMSNSSKLFRNINITAHTYEMCGYVKAALATTDLLTTIISFIPVFGQGVKAIQMSAKEAGKVAVKIALQVALYALIPIAAKNLTKMLVQNVASEWLGEDLGNAVVSGAGKYLGGNGTSGGQSPGSKSKVLAYLKERDTVIADEARYQRAIRSPFDITSQYTFLGSLYYSLIPIAYSNNSLMSSLTSSSGIVTSSIAKISPTASAIDEESVLASSGECDLLTNSAGALGDAFCNPYIITDTSTINYSPIAISEIVHGTSLNGDMVAANGNYQQILDSNFSGGKIEDNSNLAKYITFCGQRTSSYGIKDLGIAEKLSQNTATKIMDYVPLLNDVSAIYTGLQDSDTTNLEWSTGRMCVANGSNDVSAADNGSSQGEYNEWESEYKYYQRYMENMRLVENMNPGYESDITAFINDYQEKNPIDQSLEGTLARFSGMTKEQVEDTLALMEYYEFLDEYEPNERYAFVEPKESEPLLFDNDNKLAQAYYVLLNQISYSDVRNRTFAV